MEKPQSISQWRESLAPMLVLAKLFLKKRYYKICAIRAETCFLVAAMVGSIIYLSNVSNLKEYVHGNQAFLHVAHLAYTLEGRPDTLPVSFLELIYQARPLLNADISIVAHSLGNACEWTADINNRYCKINQSMKPVELKNLLAIPLNPKYTFSFVSQTHAAQYSPLCYLTFILGAWVGIKLALPPLAIMYLSILSNLSVAIILGFYTLKVLPCWRWAACYLLLVPSLFMIRCFIMPDALLFELCLFTLAMALRLSTREYVLKPGHIASIIIISALVGAWKTAYIAVPLIFTIIPARLFKNAYRKMLILGLALSCGVAASLAWGMSVYFHQVSKAPLTISPSAFKIIIEKGHKIINLEVWHKVESQMLSSYWLEFIAGGFFSWNLNWIDDLYKVLAALMPALILMNTRGIKEVSVVWKSPQRLLSGVVFALTVLLVFVALHYLLSDTNWIGQRKTLQGRHLLPALIFLLAAFTPSRTFSPQFQLYWNHISIILAVTSLLWMNITQIRSL